MHKSVSVGVPDPITFAVGADWCDRPQLYPRQVTLLKVIFLREDLFTDYDYQVLAEWELLWEQTGNKGVCPQVLERMRWLKALGHRWFREVLLVMGRRAGKGYICALAMAYVIWCYLATGDPQEHYGIDKFKQLACFIFAAKKEAAIQNLWGDLYNVITNAPCFTPFVHRALGTTLTVYAPADFAKAGERSSRGVDTTRDSASFLVDPKETSPTAGRGPAGCVAGFDEMAHVVKAVAKSEAGAVYNATTPSLDQFGVDAFICAPSSPWEMTGKFYELCLNAVEIGEDSTPVYKSKLMVQLESWAIYYDWERWEELDLLPPGFQGDLGEYATTPLPRFTRLRGAIQTYDDAMRLEERANPDTFAVERRANWATVMEAYMIAGKVEEAFQPWEGRLPEYGRPEVREQAKGSMTVMYKAHGDPAEVNCNFGFAMAHVEPDEQGLPHVVFDILHHWAPADYDDHIMDYDEIIGWIYDKAVVPFLPTEVTFDQFNSVASVRGLQKLILAGQLPKRVEAYEKTATHENNWTRYEQTKAAFNLGRVHLPFHSESHTLARNELLFLQRLRAGRVDHPTAGPVQTKDVADCVSEITSYLIGDQLDQFVFGGLRSQRVGGAMKSPGAPMGSGRDDDVFSRLGGGGGPSGRGGMGSPGRPHRR